VAPTCCTVMPRSAATSLLSRIDSAGFLAFSEISRSAMPGIFATLSANSPISSGRDSLGLGDHRVGISDRCHLWPATLSPHDVTASFGQSLELGSCRGIIRSEQSLISPVLDPSARCAGGDRACGRRLLDACGPAGCSAPRPGRTSSLTTTTLGQTSTNSPIRPQLRPRGSDCTDAQSTSE